MSVAVTDECPHPPALTPAAGRRSRRCRGGSPGRARCRTRGRAAAAPASRSGGRLHAVQADRALAGRGDHDVASSTLGRQVRDGVEAGGETARARPSGACSASGVGERRTAAGVDGAHPPQVAVVAAGLDQRGQGELVERRASRGRRGSSRRVTRRSTSDGGHDEPAQPECRRQRLADRADRDHPVRRQTLHRADRLAVVAELGVVVVLDDDSRRSRAAQSTSAWRRSGASTTPVGALVGRGDDHGAGPGGSPARRRRCRCSSTGTAHGRRPGRGGSATSSRRRPGPRRRPGARPRAASARSDEAEALREAGAHDHVRPASAAAPRTRRR